MSRRSYRGHTGLARGDNSFFSHIDFALGYTFCLRAHADVKRA